MPLLFDGVVFLLIPLPPRSTLFPTRRSSDLPRAAGGPLIRLTPERSRVLAPPCSRHLRCPGLRGGSPAPHSPGQRRWRDRKSTRLNSSHRCISYAVFCLKKKNTTKSNTVILV